MRPCCQPLIRADYSILIQSAACCLSCFLAIGRVYCKICTSRLSRKKETGTMVRGRWTRERKEKAGKTLETEHADIQFWCCSLLVYQVFFRATDALKQFFIYFFVNKLFSCHKATLLFSKEFDQRLNVIEKIENRIGSCVKLKKNNSLRPTQTYNIP